VLVQIIEVQGDVPRARQVDMFLVLEVGELPPLHLASEAIENVEVEVVHTQRLFVLQTRL
jgi:hypothetical protein